MLNATIQATTITFRSIISRVDILKSSMNALRSNEKFHHIWTSATNLARRLGLEDPVLPCQRVRQMFFDHIKSQKIITDNLTKISIFLQNNKDVKVFCSEYAKFIKLLLTAPQSVCIAERSFSSLKLLKTYFRSTVKQKKANDLAILYIHRDVANEIDMDVVVDEFISRATIRKNTFALKSET